MAGIEVKIKNARASFPALNEKTGAPGTDPKKYKYSVELILPANDPQVATIRKAILDAAKMKWHDKAEAIVNSLGADKCCLRDGNKRAKYDGYAGTMYIKASNGNRPAVFDNVIDPNDINPKTGKPNPRRIPATENRIYGGCYVNAKIEIYPHHHAVGGDQVNANLLGIQFVKDGDAFAGGGIAEPDDFDVADTGADDIM